MYERMDLSNHEDNAICNICTFASNLQLLVSDGAI